jgi:phenylacetate-CoA ligase
MSNFLETLYGMSPVWVQEAAITAYNLGYRKRYQGEYSARKQFHSQLYSQPWSVHAQVQRDSLAPFINYVNTMSSFYRRLWGGINLAMIQHPTDLRILPIVEKEDIRSHFEEVRTVAKKDACVAHTGGTTGKSLEVYYSWADAQDRQAVLDSLRERFGWRLGAKTAWFSGKTLLTESDVKRKRFWKTDRRLNIRYYSTFHLSEDNLDYYIDDLNAFLPQYLSGFPSSVGDIARFARRRKRPLRCEPKACFSTAETIDDDLVNVIEEEFHTKVVDQYSSSEGAPFIVACERGRYHFLPATGVIEVVDGRGEPADDGEAIVTCFQTHGTPLVRYRIDDRVQFASPGGNCCECGSGAPVVERIVGRAVDYLWSAERGRINLGNVSNCVKHCHGIEKFQAVQEAPDRVEILLVVDHDKHNEEERVAITKEFHDRLGSKVRVDIRYVDDIPREASGKFRIVRNLLPEKKIGRAHV